MSLPCEEHLNGRYRAASERYGAANRRRDGTDILFRSLIHRRLYDIVYRLGNGAVKISKLLTSLPAPPFGARDSRFKIIKRHK